MTSTFTAAPRERLESIKTRKKDAVAEKNRFTKLRDAAKETGDTDAQDVAEMALAVANDEYQVAS